MNLPNYIKSKIANFKPQYKDLKFDSEDDFLTWLKTKSVAKITFEDDLQDLMSFEVSETGEILHTEIPTLGNIYNGALVLDSLELMLSDDYITVWIPEFEEASRIKYKVQSIIRN